MKIRDQHNAKAIAEQTSTPFADLVDEARGQGLWIRPVARNSKRPAISGWQKPDPEWRQGELTRWADEYGDLGVGLLLGSAFPDGSKLAVLDVDRDDYVRLVRAMFPNAPCARFGSKGIALFLRLLGNGKIRKLNIKRSDGSVIHVGELLCEKSFCVIPPTIHPETDQPYQWIGKSILEVDWRDLPVIEA